MSYCDVRKKISSTIYDAMSYPGDVLLFYNMIYTALHTNNNENKCNKDVILIEYIPRQYKIISSSCNQDKSIYGLKIKL